VNSSFGPRLVNLSEATALKAGNVYAVTLRDGSLPLGHDHPYGVYLDDCRFLSGHRLTIAGAEPASLVTAETGPGEAGHELTNPELTLPDGTTLPLQTLGIRLHRRLDPAGGMDERITVRSFARAPVATDLRLEVEADLAPMLAIRGFVPMPDGHHDGLTRTGQDGITRETRISADGADGTSHLVFPVELQPGEQTTIGLRFDFLAGDAAHERPQPPPEDRPALTVDDPLVQRALDRAFSDLVALRSRLDGRDYFSAGVPWYANLFGRDSLITAFQVLPFFPGVAADTLRLLAAHLGSTDDPVTEEQPGKVLHELRLGEVAKANLTPLARYYGTVDATPLWLCLLAAHADWTGDLSLLHELRPQVDAMLAWIDGPGDRDGDGLLDYAARAPGGLRNQGWKDSEVGICFEDGEPLEPPIALVEAQGYAVRAKRELARLLAAAGEREPADRLTREARHAAERLDRFWLADRGHYAMAIGGDGRAAPTLASNQGHLLWARAVPPERAGRIRDALAQPSMHSGWGIRTLAAGVPAYNPVAYHLGSVWPHDCSLIAAGFRAYGFDAAFLATFDGLLDAAERSPHDRLPELFAGFGRDEAPVPVPYPVAAQPQAWAAGTLPYLTATALGLEPDALNRRLVLRPPLLPRRVRFAELRGLRIGGATVDVSVTRGRDTAEVTVHGDLEVVHP
jgi:glycogen debranching enzyme